MLNHSRVFQRLENALIHGWKIHREEIWAQIGAAVVYNDSVISIRFNTMKTSPFQKRFGKNPKAIHIHAETRAIKDGINSIGIDKLNKCALFILRLRYLDVEKKQMIWGMAKPCSGCQSLITHFGIKRVFYSVNQPSRGNYEIL